VSPIAGTTRDAVDEMVHRNGIDYVFVDTAGIRRKGKTKQMAEKLSVVMARRHLRMSHVAIMMIDATEGVLALDATIAGYAHEEGRAVILCVNKWDTVQTPMKRKFMEQVKDRLKFLEYAGTVFVSAKTGEGVKDLFPRVRKAYESASKRVGTGELNRFVETLRWEYEPKLKYITQASIRPPTFIAFTDAKGQLHFSAERFLVNRLREKFGFEGTPVVVKPQRATATATRRATR
jgi:GTP-binding protein